MDEDAGKLHDPDFSRLMRWGGGVLLVASLAFIAQRLWRLDWALLEAQFSWRLLGAAMAASGVIALANHALAMGWAVLADPARQLGARRAASIYGRGVLMKYLPGSIFQYIGRQVGGAEAGVPHERLARSSVTEIVLHLVASSSVAAGCLLFDASPALATLAAAIPALACLAIRRPLTTALVLQIVAFAGFALAAALVGSVVLPAHANLARFAALFLVAWLAGFVVPVAPGGLGVREAALLALAGGSFATPALVIVTLVLRLTSIAGDVAYGLLAVRRGR